MLSKKDGNFNEQPSFSTLACMQGPWQNIWLESSCSASYILLSVLLYASCYALSTGESPVPCSWYALHVLRNAASTPSHSAQCAHVSLRRCSASFSPHLLCWQKLHATFFHIVSTFNTGAALTIWWFFILFFIHLHCAVHSANECTVCTQCTQIQMLTT